MPNGDTPQQQFTPQEFAAKIKTKYPAYASIPDDQLVQKITTKYPQYKGQIKQAAGTPIDTKAQGTISAQPSMFEKLKSGVKSVAMDPFKLPEAVGSITSGIENYTPEGRKEHPVLSRIGDATKAGKDYTRLVADTLSLTGGEGIAGEAGAAAMASRAEAGKVASNLKRTQKVNEILGVSAKEVVPGKLPQSIDEFAVNPARGVLNSGMDEKKLAKLDPVERYNEMTKAKDTAGKNLNKVLEQAGQQGKTVDTYAPITKVFSKLDDPAEVSKAEKVLQESFSKHGIDIGQLDKLTPAQAQALKQDLWDEGEVGKQLYRGITEAIKKSVPEARDAMRDYSDLLGAEKAARRGAQKYITKAPQSALRKYLMKRVAPRIAEGGTLGAAGYGLYKLFGGGKGP